MRPLARILTAAAACLAFGLIAQAQTASAPLAPESGGPQILREGTVSGTSPAEYLVRVASGGTLSVDLRAEDPGVVFDILPEGSDTPVFSGAEQGLVADVPVASPGEFRVRVRGTRSAAAYSLAIGVGSPEFADSLRGGPDFWQVTGLGAGSALNLRSGPSTRFPVLGTVREGAALQNRGCRLSGPDRWCAVLSEGLSAWASGRYLREGPPPAD